MAMRQCLDGSMTAQGHGSTNGRLRLSTSGLGNLELETLTDSPNGAVGRNEWRDSRAAPRQAPIDFRPEPLPGRQHQAPRHRRPAAGGLRRRREAPRHAHGHAVPEHGAGVRHRRARHAGRGPACQRDRRCGPGRHRPGAHGVDAPGRCGGVRARWAPRPEPAEAHSPVISPA